MKKLNLLLVVLAMLTLSCSSNDDTTEPAPNPDPLTISRVDGTIFNGSGFEGIDLIDNRPVTNVDVDSDFTITFSKNVEEDWLNNESLPKLLRTENGEAVEAIPISISSDLKDDLFLNPDNALQPGTSYVIIINAGYTATDGGILEAPVFVDFTTAN